VASLPVTALGGMWRLGAPGEWVLDLALAAAGRMHARSLGAAASWLHPVGSSISASAPCPAGYPSLQLIQLLSLTVHPYCAAAAVFVTAAGGVGTHVAKVTDRGTVDAPRASLPLVDRGLWS
jgi:hypothetical protein